MKENRIPVEEFVDLVLLLVEKHLDDFMCIKREEDGYLTIIEYDKEEIDMGKNAIAPDIDKETIVDYLFDLINDSDEIGATDVRVVDSLLHIVVGEKTFLVSVNESL